MANEITARWHDSGSTLYAQVLNTTGAVYNGSTFETPADANWTDYDIALTEAGTTRFYRGTFPAVAAGLYTVLLYEQAGGSPAVADTLIGLGEVQWDGSAAVPMATILADTNELQTNQGNWLTADVSALATSAALATVDTNVDSILTQLTGSAATVATILSGSTLNIYRGDTFTAVYSGLGNISTRDTLYFTVKTSPDLTDAQATVQIEETAGLVYLNGAAGTAGQGSIVVSDEAAGDLTVTLAAAATALLVSGSYMYDIQYVTAAGAVTTVGTGRAIVTSDVTRATV